MIAERVSIPSDFANVKELIPLPLRTAGSTAFALLRLAHPARCAILLVVIQFCGVRPRVRNVRYSGFTPYARCEQFQWQVFGEGDVGECRGNVAGSFVDFASRTGKAQTLARLLPSSRVRLRHWSDCYRPHAFASLASTSHGSICAE